MPLLETQEFRKLSVLYFNSNIGRKRKILYILVYARLDDVHSDHGVDSRHVVHSMTQNKNFVRKSCGYTRVRIYSKIQMFITDIDYSGSTLARPLYYTMYSRLSIIRDQNDRNRFP